MSVAGGVCVVKYFIIIFVRQLVLLFVLEKMKRQTNATCI